MKAVNSELMSESEPAVPLRMGAPGFDEAVAKLFGTSDVNVQRAVDRFLGENPSSFDHHRLRIVAASAEVFEDKRDVAFMIRQLRPTRVELSAKPIDLATAREQFETCLPSQYRRQTRRALVLDLVRKTTLDVLENCPPDKVPEPGREIVRQELRKRLKGTLEEVGSVVKSPFLTEELLDVALDRVEATMSRLESNSEGGPFRVIDPEEMKVVFDHVFAAPSETSVVRDEHVTRAWNLFTRCDPEITILKLALSNPVILSQHGRSALQMIRAHSRRKPVEDTRRLRGMLLGSHLVPEELARDLDRALISTDWSPDPRLTILRSDHYRVADTLMVPPSEDELDQTVFEFGNLNKPEIVLAAKTPAALRTLAVRLGPYATDVSSFLANPNVTGEHIALLVDRLKPDQIRWAGQDMPMRVATLLTSRRLDDAHLAHVVEVVEEGSTLSNEKLSALLLTASCNASSGPVVGAILERHAAGLSEIELRELRKQIAVNTASTYMHTQMAQLATESGDEDIATQLMRNGTLRADIWSDLRARFPSLTPPGVQLSESAHGFIYPHSRDRDHLRPAAHRAAYQPEDVISLVSNGDAPPDRLDALLEHPAIPMSSRMQVVAGALDVGTVGEARAAELTAGVDPHLALIAATHPRVLASEQASRFRLSAERRLDDTVSAISRNIGTMPPDKRLNSWGELPNLDDEPFDLTDVHRMIDGQTVDGLLVSVPKSRRELLRLSHTMRNCLADYVEEVATNRYIVVVAKTEGDMYAATIEMTDAASSSHAVQATAATVDTTETIDAVDVESSDHPQVVLNLLEVNSRFNEGNVPPSFVDELERLSERVSSGTVAAVEDVQQRAVPAPMEMDEVVSSTESESTQQPVHEAGRRVARPARRRPIPTLRTDQNEPAQDEGRDPSREAPSLLASPGDGSQEQNMTGVSREPLDQPSTVDTTHDQGLETL